MHEGSGEITGLAVQGVRVRGVLVVEGLLRPAGEGVLGGEVTGGFSRHGVLVVPGCRVCDRLCKPRKKTKKTKKSEFPGPLSELYIRGATFTNGCV